MIQIASASWQIEFNSKHLLLSCKVKKKTKFKSLRFPGIQNEWKVVRASNDYFCKRARVGWRLGEKRKKVFWIVLSFLHWANTIIMLFYSSWREMNKTNEHNFECIIHTYGNICSHFSFLFSFYNIQEQPNSRTTNFDQKSGKKQIKMK